VVGEAWLTHPDRRQRAIAIDLPLQLIEHAFHFDGLRLQALESVGIFGWCKQNGFATMHNSVRNVALELHENIGTIEEWLATLPECGRRWLVHPIRVARRWQQAFGQRAAVLTWRLIFGPSLMLRGKHRYKM